MDSSVVLIVSGVTCCVAMALMALVTSRSNATIDHLARNAERTAERNDLSRDRFCQILIEKFQVQGDHEAVTRVAQLHANESIRKADGSYRHDHSVESIDNVAAKRELRRHAREVQTEKAMAMTTAEDGMG